MWRIFILPEKDNKFSLSADILGLAENGLMTKAARQTQFSSAERREKRHQDCREKAAVFVHAARKRPVPL
ncbi:hypothetical protein PB2503_13629 [Parvularcula bermudensis HTCC2503]|uniref:Uncharacterized protein n=1 Tax=Parvularcula bermudensis (strain ATCC BAA-594 / HTCC2503 / KCTC 12087) TaxID=314260 RepID=E0THH1_PARBH|nr:hypothetical protein PB2503_13629 [Parvularcula bermudensis HTCC2503]